MAQPTTADLQALWRRLVRECILADQRVLDDWSAEISDWADELTPDQRANGMQWVGTGLNVIGGDEPFDTWLIADVRYQPDAPIRGGISVRVEELEAARQEYTYDEYDNRWTKRGAYTLGRLS